MPSDIRATYRVQLHAGFGFVQAAAVADYLANLGIRHLYCSPYLQAARSSMHGYDVVNHRVKTCGSASTSCRRSPSAGVRLCVGGRR
jgi:maltooligosyltrehalose synthase